MAQIGSNTLSVSSSGYGSGSFTYQLIITENSYDTSARTANVTVTFQVKGVKSYYSSWSDSDATLTVSTDNGGSGSTKLNASHSTTTSSYTTVGSYTGTFTYKTDGSLTINASATFGWSSSDGNYLPLSSTITASGSCTNIGEATVDPDKVTTDFAYKGSIDSFTTPYPGTYNFEVWGGQGNHAYTSSYTGGKGGYAKGTLGNQAKNTTWYICVGGGNSSTYETGCYNGGGNGSSQYWRKGGGGGGATHISTQNALLKNSTSSNVIIVAGGGGGGGMRSGATGGTGGGTTGGNGSGATGSGSYPYGGRGGTQTGTGDSSKMVDMDSNVDGGFGYGGTGEKMSSSSYYGAGGGGAGWYGGTGGASYTSSKAGGGGGGSGYVSSSLTNTSMSNGTQSGNGKASINYSHKVLLVNYEGGYSGTTVKENDQYDVAQPYTQTFTPVKVTKSSSSSDTLNIALNTNGGNTLDDLTTTLTSTSTSTANSFTDGTNSYTAGTSTSVNITDNITLNPTWTTSTSNTYSSVTMPVPTKDSASTSTTLTTTITFDGNGGTW